MSETALIETIDGGIGQTLKVFDDHCIITTSSKFNGNNTASLYSMLNRQTTPQKGILDKEDTQNAIVNGLLHGSVVKTGLRVGLAAGIDTMKNALGLAKDMFSVTPGERTVLYKDYERVEYMNAGVQGLGYIKFQNQESLLDPSQDVLFFFGGPNILNRSKINKSTMAAYEIISPCVEKAKEIVKQQSSIAAEATTQSVSSDNKFAEIKKYKELLDMGVLTEEEFSIKKKELLGL